MKTTLTVLLIIQLYGLASCAIKQHYFIDQMKTWNDALNHCRTFYHDLSTFTSATEEKRFLQEAVNQTSDAWVGLYKESGIWRWSGGDVATRISWDTTQPDNDNFAFLKISVKKLHDRVRADNRTFFCMTFEFVVMQQSESWEGALEYCRHHHDDLASLSSNRSKEYALSKITGAGTQYVWIGLRFLAEQWFWISGYEVQDWVKYGQPQCPATNQRCGAMNKNTQTWAPRDCEEKLNFLCF
ncbi:putative secretory phospholipase A2 receptor-like [Triplophysa rosa]|uniref:Secretory phospholipase A2 receptor-like n=1 Tax=Triplophysa rosa TaxID=992332 RepID=A0A9W8C5W8_TRIRA|nr:putative secretory phospholipase A2 receptor-like [Triplophysa rosa]